MDCIRCHIRMNKEIKNGVLIDTCPICDGVWLDKDELKMLESGQKKLNAELLKELYNEIDRERFALEQKDGLCPKCDTASLIPTMVKGVEIDRCPSCHGAFFDWGEIEAILVAGGES